MGIKQQCEFHAKSGYFLISVKYYRKAMEKLSTSHTPVPKSINATYLLAHCKEKLLWEIENQTNRRLV